MLRTILFPPLPSSTTPAIDAELDLLLRCADFCDAAYYINEKDKNDPFHESPKLKQQYKINDFKNWDRHGNRAISFTTKKENVDISSMFVDDKFPSNTTVVVVAFRGTSSLSETFEDLKSYKKAALYSGMAERNKTSDGSGTASNTWYKVFFEMIRDSLSSGLFFKLISAYNNRRLKKEVTTTTLKLFCLGTSLIQHHISQQRLKIIYEYHASLLI
jgi:hypothetical protein